MAVRAAAGIAAVAATALLAARVEWRRVVWCGDERRVKRDDGDGVSGGVDNHCSCDAESEALRRRQSLRR